MFNGNKKYIWMFSVMFVMVIALQYFLPKPVNWQRTYSRDDKNPFGANALFRLIKPAYTNSVSVNKSTVYNLVLEEKQTQTLFLLNDALEISKTDLSALLEFTEKGNSVFMAANVFRGVLADTFHLRTESKSYTYFMSTDSLLKKPGVTLKQTALNLSKEAYTYPIMCYDSYFSNFDSTRFNTLSINEDTGAVCIRTKIGKGNLYLMSMPDVFTNFFIVSHPNRKYAYGILSHLAVEKSAFIWDEYYKRYNKSKDSFLRFIFENDALYYAYLLMLLTIITYMVFEGRRRQSAIPVLEPVKNTTLEFVDVITHVYYNHKSHGSIIKERIRYFYDTVRKRFSVSTDKIDETFFLQLSELSGCDVKQVRQLFTYTEKLRRAEQVQEHDLLELNRQINNFNHKSLR